MLPFRIDAHCQSGTRQGQNRTRSVWQAVVTAPCRAPYKPVMRKRDGGFFSFSTRDEKSDCPFFSHVHLGKRDFEAGTALGQVASTKGAALCADE